MAITCWKQLIRRIKILVLICFLFVAGYFCIALLLSFTGTHPPEQTCAEKKNVFLNTNGVHVDFIIPVSYLEPEFLNQLDYLPGTQYVAFGWGDKNFYINTPDWSDLTLPVAFKALFLKSEAAIHITHYPWKSGSWKSLSLCDQQLHSLIVYIKNTFQQDEKGRLIKMDFEGYNQYDVFFEAEGNFSLFNTCNVWVNKGLKTIEVRTAVWTPFDFGVLHYIN